MKELNKKLLDTLHENSIYKKLVGQPCYEELMWWSTELMSSANECNNTNELRNYLQNLDKQSSFEPIIDKGEEDKLINNNEVNQLKELYEKFINNLIKNKEREDRGEDFSKISTIAADVHKTNTVDKTESSKNDSTNIVNLKEGAACAVKTLFIQNGEGRGI